MLVFALFRVSIKYISNFAARKITGDYGDKQACVRATEWPKIAVWWQWRWYKLNDYEMFFYYEVLYCLIRWQGGRVEPILTVADNSFLCTGQFNISVTLPSDFAESFKQNVQSVEQLELKSHSQYAVFLFKSLLWNCWTLIYSVIFDIITTHCFSDLWLWILF